jgi:hypothetical protein
VAHAAGLLANIHSDFPLGRIKQNQKVMWRLTSSLSLRFPREKLIGNLKMSRFGATGQAFATRPYTSVVYIRRRLMLNVPGKITP